MSFSFPADRDGANANEWRPPRCEVPGCPSPTAKGLYVCDYHLAQPASPKDRGEALAHLRARLAEYEHHWPRLDVADGFVLHGSYDIAALRLLLDGPAPTGESAGPS